MSWQDRAACRGLDWSTFFPEPGPRGVPPDWTAARTVCRRRCPVAGDCAAYADVIRATDGMWGGLTPGERKERRRAA
jgi:WhiB family transcriptional regulator, redox-sensing transcriptional regulator